MDRESKAKDFNNKIKEIVDIEAKRVDSIDKLLDAMQKDVDNISATISVYADKLPISKLEEENPDARYSSHNRLPNELRIAYSIASELARDISIAGTKLQNYRPIYIGWSDSDIHSFARRYDTLLVAIQLSGVELDF